MTPCSSGIRKVTIDTQMGRQSVPSHGTRVGAQARSAAPSRPGCRAPRIPRHLGAALPCEGAERPVRRGPSACAGAPCPALCCVGRDDARSLGVGDRCWPWHGRRSVTRSAIGLWSQRPASSADAPACRVPWAARPCVHRPYDLWLHLGRLLGVAGHGGGCGRRNWDCHCRTGA